MGKKNLRKKRCLWKREAYEKKNYGKKKKNLLREREAFKQKALSKKKNLLKKTMKKRNPSEKKN